MSIEIKLINSRWTVNGLSYSQASFIERLALNEFFLTAKTSTDENCNS